MTFYTGNLASLSELKIQVIHEIILACLFEWKDKVKGQTEIDFFLERLEDETQKYLMGIRYVTKTTSITSSIVSIFHYTFFLFYFWSIFLLF